jgi:hypothetical protein
MLNFLRKIRQKLLLEGNLKRYLVYAFGEIILVMIGILLALQVNNWKTNNQLKSIERSTLLEISDALDSDLSQIDRALNLYNRSKSNLNGILDYISMEIDDHPNMDRMWASGFLQVIIKFNLSSFDLLKIRGFDIIRDSELRKQIQFHYDISIPYYLSYENRNYSVLESFRNRYLSQLEFYTRKDSVLASRPINREAMGNDIQILSGLHHATFHRKRSIEELLALKQSAESLKTEIQDYLNKDG